MARIDTTRRVLEVKLVYYGPAMGGKTTNLRSLHQLVDPTGAVELQSLDTEGDRTLFFDLLPLDLGEACGLKVRVRLFTVPGQAHYNATRRIVLQGVDTVVFVADSSPGRLQANRESIANLRANLVANGVGPGVVPIVLQANKRDVPDAAPLEAVEAELALSQLGDHGRTVLPELVPASAFAGTGVVEAFEAGLKAALAQAFRHHSLQRLGLTREKLASTVDEALAPVRARVADRRTGPGSAAVPARGMAAEAGRRPASVVPPAVTADVAEKVMDVESLLAASVTQSLDLAQALGDRSAVATALARRVSELETINALATSLTRTVDVAEIAAALARAAAAALPDGAASVLLPDARGTLVARALHGMDADPFLSAGSPSLAWTVHRLSRPVAYADVDTDLVFGDATLLVQVAPYCTAAAVPLDLPTGSSGLLVAYGADPDARAGAETLRFLAAVASSGALALQNARRHAQLLAHQEQLEEQVAERTEELRAAHQELLASAHLKDRILSCVNHELRTPVTKLLTAAQVLERNKPGVVPPPAFLGNLVKHAKHLAGLLDQALAARALLAPSGDEGSAGPLRASLARTLEAVAFSFHERAASRQVVLRLGPLEGLPDVAAESGPLSLLLSQVLDNAVKFTQPGTEVLVDAERRPDGRVRIAVRDRGPGVRAEDVDRIFAEFDQGGADQLVAKPEGLGLGLAIARRIARRFGGDVSVRQDDAVGATFLVDLPAADVVAAVAG